jgi:hypothetical protein
MNWLKSDYFKFSVVIILAGILFYFLFISLNKKNTSESFQDVLSNEEEMDEPTLDDQYNDNMVKVAPEPSQALGNNEDFKKYDDAPSDNNTMPNDCYPKDQIAPSELLPGDADSKWAQVNPSGQGDLKDQNFLNAGHHIGTNTVGQTLRNANLQLRSDPPVPQVSVSPWMQTTIEPDSNRKAFEIGGY